MRDGNPANRENWAIVCSGCGTQFADDETIDLANGHVATAHPDIEGIHFNTVWIGKGRPPTKLQMKRLRSIPPGRRRRR